VRTRPTVRRPVAAGHARRPRPIRRASAGLSAVRAGGALAMLVAAAAMYGVGASSAFEYRALRVDGARFTDVAQVESILGDARGRNLFRLSTEPFTDGLLGLPTVAHARVEVRLPGTIAVTLVEREPILVWQVGDERLLVDREGSLFALARDAVREDVVTLPVIDDRRAASVGLTVGRTLDPVDLDAATRLGSLVPADLGSAASALAITVSDAHGFVVLARPEGWTAVFGFYTISLRTTAIIPGQVRLLRSLLDGREETIERVILADEDDGTYIPRATPEPSPSPSG
jgi:cell division septal protein FtsQ